MEKSLFCIISLENDNTFHCKINIYADKFFLFSEICHFTTFIPDGSPGFGPKNKWGTRRTSKSYEKIAVNKRKGRDEFRYIRFEDKYTVKIVDKV